MDVVILHGNVSLREKRFSYSRRAEWPSCRFVVTTSLPYRRILPAKETWPPGLRQFRRRDEFCERGKGWRCMGRWGHSVGWVYPQSSVLGQIKHEVARSFRLAWNVSFTRDSQRIMDWTAHAFYFVVLYGIWTFNFISLSEWIYTARSEILIERRQLHLHLRVHQMQMWTI